MLRTLSIVISIALADSLNASTIGPALVLASGEHPRRSVFEFSLGVVAVFFLGGALLVLGPGRALLGLVPHPSATARYIVETVAGVAMVVWSVVIWRRGRSTAGHAGEHGNRGQAGGHGDDSEDRSPDDREQRQDDGARTQRGKSPALMGAGIALVELPTAFPYFAAITTIVSSGLALWRQLLLVAVYDFCFVLPLYLIILVLTVAGDRATETLAAIRTRVQAHGHALAVAAAFVVGVCVTVLGVTGLASSVPGRTGRVSRRIRHVISR